VKFPNSGNRKLKVEELRLEQEELDQELNQELAEVETNFYKARNTLLRKIKLSKNFNKLSKSEAQELNKIIELIQKRQGFDPLLILDIKEALLKSQLEEIKYNQEVYLEYIQYLSESGKLGQSPFVNYLKA